MRPPARCNKRPSPAALASSSASSGSHGLPGPSSRVQLHLCVTGWRLYRGRAERSVGADDLGTFENYEGNTRAMLVFAWRKFLQFEGRRLYPDKGENQREFMERPDEGNGGWLNGPQHSRAIGNAIGC